jgi:plastocyanin
MRTRTLVAGLGLVALAASGLAASAAGAEGGGPKAVSVNIVGGDHFPHPGLLTNDMRFPDDPIVVAQGGRITFHNKTNDGHTVALVNRADLPTTVKQVFNCPLCDAINSAFGIGPSSSGPPAGVQLDNGKLTDDDAQADADAVDAGAIASAKTPLPPGLSVLIADFDTPSHGSTIGDATLMDTADPTNGHGAPTQRTIRVTAAPGLYHYYCTIHPWMQGTIRVVRGDN